MGFNFHNVHCLSVSSLLLYTSLDQDRKSVSHLDWTDHLAGPAQAAGCFTLKGRVMQTLTRLLKILFDLVARDRPIVPNRLILADTDTDTD